MRLRQAGVTDDVPLHLLAGNVLPMAKGHHMTTVDVRNSSLVLVVAVPKDNAAFPAVRVCGSRPAGCHRGTPPTWHARPRSLV